MVSLGHNELTEPALTKIHGISGSEWVNSSCGGTKLFQFNIVNVVVSDALAPCIARTSVSTHDIVYVEKVLVLHVEGFQLCHVSVEEWYKLYI